jgi:hypothetical protein
VFGGQQAAGAEGHVKPSRREVSVAAIATMGIAVGCGVLAGAVAAVAGRPPEQMPSGLVVGAAVAILLSIPCGGVGAAMVAWVMVSETGRRSLASWLGHGGLRGLLLGGVATAAALALQDVSAVSDRHVLQGLWRVGLLGGGVGGVAGALAGAFCWRLLERTDG